MDKRDELKGLGGIIVQRFRIIHKFPERTAIVYVVEEQVRDASGANKKLVAKRLNPKARHRQDIADWFGREINISYKLKSHPNIVELIDPYRYDVEEGINYAFFEYVEGRNLNELIHQTWGKSLSLPQLLIWGLQISDAMVFATDESKNQSGVYVHRDLDSSNILISKSGAAKVSDWGMAKDLLLPDDQLMMSTLQDYKEGAIGKISYMPPELLPPHKGKNYQVSGDIYYMGGLLYEMLTGLPVNPVERETELRAARSEEDVLAIIEDFQQRRVIPTLRSTCRSEALCDLVINCLHPDARRRIDNFETVHSGLREIAEQFRVSAGSETYLSCQHCGLIILESHRQQHCPLCNEFNAFSRWDPATMLQAAPAARKPDPDAPASIIDTSVPVPEVIIPPPIITPPPVKIENALLTIPAGKCIIGAKKPVLDRLVREFDLSGPKLTQFSFPSERSIYLKEFSISRCAVSNDEYREFVEKTGWRAPGHWQQLKSAGTSTYQGDHPVVNVNFLDAEAFCQWKGVRLPSNDEWEKAARGDYGWAYPWGDGWENPAGSFLCNTLERHEATEEALVSVQAFENRANRDRPLNMAGNVWEWVDGGENEMKHTRGGSWRYMGQLFALTWYRLPTQGHLREDDVGFRYVKQGERIRYTTVKDPDKYVTVATDHYRLGVSAHEVEQLTQEFNLSQGDRQVLLRNEKRFIHMKQFQIRKYLVTNEEYYRFVIENDYPWPKHWRPELLKWSEYPFLEKYRFHPVTNVSYRDATAFCAWCNGRLPSNDEWEVAARGPESLRYPWGNKFNPEYCNAESTALARTTDVNQFRSGQSPWGCFDMAGNVQEWVAVEDEAYYLRGGSFEQRGDIYGLTFLKLFTDADHQSESVGFRCVV